MKITSVRVNKTNGEGKVQGFADVTVENCLAIHNIRIIQGDRGLFIAFPSVKRIDENNSVKHSDLVHPINPDTRKVFEDAILAEFNKVSE